MPVHWTQQWCLAFHFKFVSNYQNLWNVTVCRACLVPLVMTLLIATHVCVHLVILEYIVRQVKYMSYVNGKLSLTGMSLFDIKLRMPCSLSVPRRHSKQGDLVSIYTNVVKKSETTQSD